MAKKKYRNTTGKPQNVLRNEAKINKKITDEILPSLPSFVSDYNEYLDTEGRSVKTRYAYLFDLIHFFDYMVSDTGLSDAASTRDVTLSDMEALKGKDINAYLTYVKRYEAPDGTIIENGKDARARKRSSIVGLLKFLYRGDMIEYDVTGKVLPISVKVSERSVKALQENEVFDLLDVVSTGDGLTDHQKHYWEKTRYRDKFILTLFVVTGLRISELQQLNISSFNLKREEFTIYRKRGKESVMPMNQTLITAYTEYMEMDRGHCADIAPGYEDALFLCLSTEKRNADGTKSPVGRKRLSTEQIRALVHKYSGIATGGKGVSPHRLRASAASAAIRRGHDISRVASLLDHDNIQTTKRYVQVNDEDKRKVLSDMEINPSGK